MQELLYHSLVFIHILAGSSALLASVVAFATPKGNRGHRLGGRVFFWSMIVTGLGALQPALYSGKLVLLYLAVFSLHLTITGRRYLQFRRGRPPHWSDYALMGAMLLFAGLLLLDGIPTFVRAMGWVGALAPAAFAFISLGMVWEDWKWLNGREGSPRQALRQHISRMGGASIAAFTAFFVNANSLLPGALAWLLPTVIGTFLIVYHQRRLRDMPKERHGAAPNTI